MSPVEGHTTPVEGHTTPVEGHTTPVEGHTTPVEGHTTPGIQQRMDHSLGLAPGGGVYTCLTPDSTRHL